VVNLQIGLSDILQIVVSGLAMGCVYALVALGFTITYNSLRVINFAQGDMFMLGAVFGLTIFMNIGGHYFASLILAGLGAAVVGMIIERIIFRPLRNSPPLNLIIATIGISITIRAGAQMIWGSQAMSFPPVFGSTPVKIGTVVIMPSYLWIIAIALASIVLLTFFFKKTLTGKAMLATAQHRDAAAMMGINIFRSDSIAASISAGLGGIGGVLVGPIFFVETEMGAIAALKGFAAAVLGGFGSVPGAIAGGVMLGLAENLSASLISSAYRDAVAFLVLIGVLVFKPNGILGKKVMKV
jgi:branched-chain amino acid transport system permease protein